MKSYWKIIIIRLWNNRTGQPSLVVPRFLSCLFLLSWLHRLAGCPVIIFVFFLFPAVVTSALVNSRRHFIIRQTVLILCRIRKSEQIPVDLLVGYFGIDLCCTNRGMPHHPADGFNGYTITEANERGKTMPGHVEGQMTSQFALFFYHLQAAAQTAGCRYEEKFSVLSLSLVFVDNATWNIE